ncbi:hypothetical protein BS47DRAFT_1360850 [Hydnum rufescens UP504]|uniref:Uncharacterized protein n=1 Tax=Hydnum rufescens UP504 TaxID=1448309 RepID=A0A9P6B3D2_9AGAM|nr:hypothetical protein BS47DRAFT_1360850 [Hydnum rufescens UP504]
MTGKRHPPDKTREWGPMMQDCGTPRHKPHTRQSGFHLPPHPKQNLRMTEHDARPQKPGMNPTPASAGMMTSPGTEYEPARPPYKQYHIPTLVGSKLKHGKHNP